MSDLDGSLRGVPWTDVASGRRRSEGEQLIGTAIERVIRWRYRPVVIWGREWKEVGYKMSERVRIGPMMRNSEGERVEYAYLDSIVYRLTYDNKTGKVRDKDCAEYPKFAFHDIPRYTPLGRMMDYTDDLEARWTISDARAYLEGD